MMSQNEDVFALFTSEAAARGARDRLVSCGVDPEKVKLTTHGSAPPHRVPSRGGALAAAAATLALALAVLCLSWASFCVAAAAAAVVRWSRPSDREHRLLIRDELLATGGALLTLRAGRADADSLAARLRRDGAVDVHHGPAAPGDPPWS